MPQASPTPQVLQVLIPRFVHSHSGEQITNLQLPTAFTLSNWITFSGCGGSAGIFVETNYATIPLEGVNYTAQPVVYDFTAGSGLFSTAYTFEQLIVTMFTPGEVLTVVFTRM
jgi:hypothetical protein